MYCGRNIKSVIIIIHSFLDKYYMIFWEETRQVSVANSANIPNKEKVRVREKCDVSAAGKLYSGRVAATRTLYIYIHVHVQTDLHTSSHSMLVLCI